MKLDLPAGTFIQTPENIIKPEDIEGWLVEGIIPKGAVGEIFGDSATGKTFLALRIMAEVAKAGRSALILTDELRQHDWNRRTLAMKEGGILKDSDLERLGRFALEDFESFIKQPVRVSNAPPDLKEGKAWGLFIEKLNEDYPSGLGLVVVDTFSNFFGGDDENMAKDTADFFAGVRKLSKKLRCSIIVIHHASKGKAAEARGSNVHLNNVDFSYVLQKDGERCILRNLKFKETAAGKRWHVRFEEVPIRLFDENGKAHEDSSLIAAELVPI